MKKLTTLLLALAAFQFVNAQIQFKTGDAELEIKLNEVNKEAKADINLFTSDLNKSTGLAIDKIKDLLKKLQPAEIVLAEDISIITNKPIDTVIKSYEANKDAGWGKVAKDMGIKPGSAEFHALKGKVKGKSKGKGNGKGNSGHAKGKGKK